jgi:protein ImuA
MDPSRLAALRARITALEGTPRLQGRDATPAAAPFGVAAIDTCLPWGGLPAGGLHEIRPGHPERIGAAHAFAAFCLGRLGRQRTGPLLWVGRRDDLYPPGLVDLGLPLERLLLVRPARVSELSWVLEEGLRCQALAGLLGEVDGLDFTTVRRLSLASRASGVAALLLNRGAPLAALLTRWQVAAAPSDGPIGVGAWRWTVTLTRCRGLPAGESERAPSWWVEVKQTAAGAALSAEIVPDGSLSTAPTGAARVKARNR